MVRRHAVPATLGQSASLLANAVLGALQQYCVTTCGYMLHDMRQLCTAFHGSTAWTWPRSHKEQMQYGEEHAVKSPILRCARAVTLCPDSMRLHGLPELVERLVRLPRPAHQWFFRDVHIGHVAQTSHSVPCHIARRLLA